MNSHDSSKNTSAFWLLFPATGFILIQLPISITGLKDLPGLFYSVLILSWMFSVMYRITDKDVRRLLVCASLFMVLLYFLRSCRYSFFDTGTLPYRLFHYFYHIPYTGLAVLAFCAALRTGSTTTKSEKVLLQKRLIKTINIIWLLLIVILISSEFHHLFIYYDPPESKHYIHGVFYYASVAFELILTLSSLIVILHRCSNSAVRSKWYIPASCMICGIALIVIQQIWPSFPTIWDHKVYQEQDAVCLLFIASFESCIRIGLIPSNTGYYKLFSLSHINASILDESGNAVYISEGAEGVESPVSHAAESTVSRSEGSPVSNAMESPVSRSERSPVSSATESIVSEAAENSSPAVGNIRLRSQKIHGGSVCWIEDITMINELNEKLRSVTKETEEENELIRQEKELLEEKLSLEIKNRLYDRIDRAVRPQTEKICEILSDMAQAENKNAGLEKICLLGAYIKRMGNLYLLSAENGIISSSELALSIMESFEALKLSGKTTFLEHDGNTPLPAAFAISCYEFMQNLLVFSYESMAAVTASLYETSQFVLRLSLDIELPEDYKENHGKKLSECGAELDISESDETTTIRITLKKA